jgi:hypothetical protein
MSKPTCMRTAVWFAALALSAACVDGHPTLARTPGALRDLAPLPASAVTVNASDISAPGSVMFYGYTKPARVAFWNFSWVGADPLGTGTFRPFLHTNSWAAGGDFGVRIFIDGGVRASAVRVMTYVYERALMQCYTANGDTLNAEIPEPPLYTTVYGALDVQGSGITNCRFFGDGWIESFSFVPQPKNQTPKLVLSCAPNPITRGDPIRCDARAEPAGTVSEMAWMFADSAGHTITGPTGTVLTWGGTMVVGGLMRVSGKVNGVASVDSARVAVRSRVWAHRPLNAQERGHGDLPAPNVVAADGEMAHTHVDQPSTVPAHEIQDGPNSGWVLVDSMPEVQVTTHLNDAWTPGSVWYALQQGGVYVDPVSGGVGHYCRPREIPSLFTLARKHEGAGLPQHHSHVDVFRNVWSSHPPENSIEAEVTYLPDFQGSLTVVDWFRGVWGQWVITPLMGDPNQNHTNDTPPGLVPPAVFPCKVRY